MRRIAVAIGACVCLAAVVAAELGRAQVAEDEESKSASSPAENSSQSNSNFGGGGGGGAALGGGMPGMMGMDMSGAGYPGAMPGMMGGTMPMGGFPGMMGGMMSGPADSQVGRLLNKWRKAERESQRSEVEKQLRETLKAQFQARFVVHDNEVKQLEAKVKQLREQLELRREKQDQIVEFRARQLLNEAQGLGWGSGYPSTAFPPGAFGGMGGMYGMDSGAMESEYTPPPEEAQTGGPGQ